MFRFAYPGYLLLLLVLPAIVGLYSYSRALRKKRIRRFGNIRILQNLMPDHSKYEPGIRLILVLIIVGALIFAYARPWGGIHNQESSRQGIEIVIAVDASNSMLASATDDEKGLDRMRTSKLLLEKLINRLSNDRVGLIAYAGDAYTLIPVTNDYVSAKTFLNSIDPSQIPYQGTNIGSAIKLATKSFSKTGDIGKAIILLTDADELEDPVGALNAVSEAAKMGIQTDVIGIGSVPVTIPDPNQGRLIDPETGQVVRTGLNEDLAIGIADTGKGIYVNASNPDALDELMKQIGKLKKSKLESSFKVSHDELYIVFAIIALIALILDFIITDKKNKWIDRLALFRRNQTLLLIIISVYCISSCTHNKDNERNLTGYSNNNDSILSVYSLPKEKELIDKGNIALMSNQLETADSSYTEALKINPHSVVAPLNDGLAAMMSAARMQESLGSENNDSVLLPLIKKANDMWQQSSSPLVEKANISSLAFYNLGNLDFLQEQYDKAIESYEDALRLNPSDDHARRNLRIAQLRKKEQENNQQNQQQKQSQEQQNQEQQKQEQQQPSPQNINEQISQQILDAAERKENQKRVQMQINNKEESGRRSTKNW